jgi:hypothetical protein
VAIAVGGSSDSGLRSARTTGRREATWAAPRLRKLLLLLLLLLVQVLLQLQLIRPHQLGLGLRLLLLPQLHGNEGSSSRKLGVDGASRLRRVSHGGCGRAVAVACASLRTVAPVLRLLLLL